MEIQDLDLYELLNVNSNCSVQEVKKAYRKKALTCHPDKNPDNPEAVRLFLQLSKALEILTDDTARAAYDKVLNGKKLAKIRHRELDARRKKFKEDLEERERRAEANKFCDITDGEKLRAEIERLRKEGSKQVQEEQEYVRQQILREKGTSYIHQTDVSTKLKISWKNCENDSNTPCYDEVILHKILSKYGDIEALIVSKKKKKKNISTALVEFKTPQAAENAMQLEKGFPNNPLLIEWLDKPKSTAFCSQFKEQNAFPAFPSEKDGTQRNQTPSSMSTSQGHNRNKMEPVKNFSNGDDFETQVLRKLKLAQEMKSAQAQSGVS